MELNDFLHEHSRHCSSIYGFFQVRYLTLGDLTPVSGLQTLQRDLADSCAHEPENWVDDGCYHAPNLPVLSSQKG